MRVLVACEFSGIVRDAFAARGHDAWSCDLLPTERPGNHIQGDVSLKLKDGWDLIVACPPCTYLTYAGTAHWNNPGRKEKREAAMNFFMLCYNSPCKMVCVENPFGYPCQNFRKPNQIINPYDFGEPVRKRTCLWLRGLTNLNFGGELFAMPDAPLPCPPPPPIYIGTRMATGKKKSRHATDCNRPRVRNIHYVESLGYNGNRALERSRFFESIAKAMASQWG